MIPSKSIKGEKVKELITKFFYKGNHLCYQIILHLKDDDPVAYSVFNDYSSYKQAFNEIQKMRSKNALIEVSNENLVSGSVEGNMA